jgi:hypothetical protein
MTLEEETRDAESVLDAIDDLCCGPWRFVCGPNDHVDLSWGHAHFALNAALRRLRDISSGRNAEEAILNARFLLRHLRFASE